MADKNNQSAGKKAAKSFFGMFKRLFVRDKADVNVLDEEAMRTPGKVIFHNLIHNKLAIIGFIGFLCVFLFSFLGSQLMPFVPLYYELTNSNQRPSQNYLTYPESLADKEIVKIVSGVSFSFALTTDGNLTAWGTECNRAMNNVSEPIFDIPQEVSDAFIVDIEAGNQHIVCVDDEGNFYGWGYHGNDQTILPNEVVRRREKIVKMAAMSQWTAVLSERGTLYVWGSTQAVINFVIPRSIQGRIVDMAAGDNNMVLVLNDRTIRVIGLPGNEFSEQVPPELTDGSVKVAEVAATNHNVLVRDEDGKLYLWGSPESGLNRFPENLKDEKVIDIAAGYKNFVVVDDDGEVTVWGADELKQLKVPKTLSKDTRKVYATYFQFYAVDGNGKITGAWGNKGYLWGSDQFGRDMFIRIIHGGRVSLTIGAIALLIEIFIAILVGLPSGYFGGWLDHMLMRLADIVDSIPFLPLAVTLSFVLRQRLANQQMLFMIMVILGILGWTGLARLIRAQILLEREKDFVLAARSLGIKQRNIMVKHILPNVFNLVIVNITLGYASFLLTEAGLSFLGFGVQEPNPSWGNMLTGAEQSIVLQFYWWRWIIPALFVIAAALSINLIGDALREAMDPKSNER